MPVTHGVASSSLVRTAVERGDEQQKDFGLGCSFFFLYTHVFMGRQISRLAVKMSEYSVTSAAESATAPRLWKMGQVTLSPHSR